MKWRERKRKIEREMDGAAAIVGDEWEFAETWEGMRSQKSEFSSTEINNLIII